MKIGNAAAEASPVSVASAFASMRPVFLTQYSRKQKSFAAPSQTSSFPFVDDGDLVAGGERSSLALLRP